MPRAALLRPRSLSDEASSTNTRAGRITASGAFDEHAGAEVDARDAADEQRAGEAEVDVAEEQVAEGGRARRAGSPARGRCRPAAFAVSVGYSSRSITIISEPEPTEVMPTMKPPARPTITVATRFTRRSGAAVDRRRQPAPSRGRALQHGSGDHRRSRPR